MELLFVTIKNSFSFHSSLLIGFWEFIFSCFLHSVLFWAPFIFQLLFDYHTCNWQILSPFCGLHLHSINTLLCYVEPFRYMIVHLFPVGYISCSSEVLCRRSLPVLTYWSLMLTYWSLLSTFTVKSFQAVKFYAEILDPLEIHFCAGWDIGFQFHFSTCFLALILKMISFLLCTVLAQL